MKIKRYVVNVIETALQPGNKEKEFTNLEVLTRPPKKSS